MNQLAKVIVDALLQLNATGRVADCSDTERDDGQNAQLQAITHARRKILHQQSRCGNPNDTPIIPRDQNDVMWTASHLKEL